jgi:hypothetical protein
VKASNLALATYCSAFRWICLTCFFLFLLLCVGYVEWVAVMGKGEGGDVAIYSIIPPAFKFILIILAQFWVHQKSKFVVWCFIIVSVYTICGTDIPLRFYFYYMFRPEGAIFRYSRIRAHNPYFFSCCSPHTGQCLHIGSALYVWFYVMPCVTKRIKHWIFKILK